MNLSATATNDSSGHGKNQLIEHSLNSAGKA